MLTLVVHQRSWQDVEAPDVQNWRVLVNSGSAEIKVSYVCFKPCNEMYVAEKMQRPKEKINTTLQNNKMPLKKYLEKLQKAVDSMYNSALKHCHFFISSGHFESIQIAFI
jgi:hypothetical protein